MMDFFKDFPVYRQEGWEPSKVPYLQYSLVFALVVYLFESYLDLRQHKKLHEKELPQKVVDAMQKLDAQRVEQKAQQQQQSSTEIVKPEVSKPDEDGPTTTLIKKEDKGGEEESQSYVQQTQAKFQKAQAYGLDKSSFHLMESFIDQIISVGITLWGFTPYLWDYSTEVAAKCGYGPENEIVISILFTMIGLTAQTIFSLPFGLYRTFVIEERHGFNKQTLSLYFIDKVKGLLLTYVLGTPCIAGLLAVMIWGGEYFYVYVWGFLFVLSLVMMTVYPVLIAPLFNKYSPLEDGDLKTRIEALAQKLEFPLTRLYVVDGSTRSAHSNAYMYGMFKNKRIVLFDTLLTQATAAEIEAILGHELGHWKLSHTIEGFIISQVYTFITFACYGLAKHLEKDILLSFGLTVSSQMLGLMLFMQCLWAPIDHCLSFAMTALSRKNEFAADEFANDLGYGLELQLGLTKLELKNMSNMNPDSLYSKYHYSHPPLVERLQAITDGKKKRE